MGAHVVNQAVVNSGLGRARTVAVCLARTEDTEAEFLNRQMLAHLCRASSTPQYPYPADSRSAYCGLRLSSWSPPLIWHMST